MEKAVLKVGGMTCGGCVRSVARVLEASPGVAKVSVSLERNEADIEFDPAVANLAQLKLAIENAGYEVR